MPNKRNIIDDHPPMAAFALNGFQIRNSRLMFDYLINKNKPISHPSLWPFEAEQSQEPSSIMESSPTWEENCGCYRSLDGKLRFSDISISSRERPLVSTMK